MSALLDWAAAHGPLLRRTALEHLTLSAVSLALVVGIAVPVGIALVRRPGATGIVVGIVTTLRTVPSLALLVLMLPLLGTGTPPSIVALVLYGLPAVLLNTLAGLRGVDRDVVEAAQGQGLSPAQILGRIELPLAAPVILAGIRTAAVQLVSAATLAVFIGGGGFGELISAGMGLFDVQQLVVGALAVAAMAATAELGFAGLERGLARRLGAEAGA